MHTHVLRASPCVELSLTALHYISGATQAKIIESQSYEVWRNRPRRLVKTGFLMYTSSSYVPFTYRMGSLLPELNLICGSFSEKMTSWPCLTMELNASNGLCTSSTT